jgi:hypothetical protein
MTNPLNKNHPLMIERRTLANAASNAYSPENFPGSTAWRACRAAEKALDAFDAAHPEVLAAINADRAANPPSYVRDPGSHYNRALRGED